MLVMLELVSLKRPEDDPSVAQNTILCHFQNADGCHLDIVITDAEPVTMGELLAVWQDYKPKVDKAVEDGTPWPAGPSYSLEIKAVP